MPTYGEKWRAASSACEAGHVPRSCQTTFLRLDSTGEISSVDRTSQANKTRVGSTPPREVNGNMIGMKNWVTSSVLGVNGLRSANNFTNSGKGRNTMDFNANVLDRLADSVPSNAVNMNPNMPKCPNNFLYPQTGIPGWNYPRHNFGVVGNSVPIFPCHQFNNPFVAPFGVVPQQGKMDVFASPEYMTSVGNWTQAQMMDDHHWHQRHRKFDRSYRGHAPKHHKHEYAKHDGKTFPSEQVPPKFSGKRKQDKRSFQRKSESPNPVIVDFKCQQNMEQQCSKSKHVETSEVVNASLKCKNQVKPDDDKFAIENEEIDGQKESKSDNGKVEICAQVVQLNSKDEGDTIKENQMSFSKKSDKTITPEIAKSCESSLVESKDGSTKMPDQSDRQESNFHVLFVRKNWKKGRPSSSKQRRRKLQKAKSTDSGTSANNCIDNGKYVNDARNGANSENDRNGRCNGTVAFILGLSTSPTSDKMPNCNSGNSRFVFSISDNEDDEGEGESDVDNDADWEAEFTNFSQCDLFNFLPQNNSVSTSPLNFQVQISPVQGERNSQEKSMDDINSSWNIQISVLDDREKCKRKKKTSKKVHFPEDKDLSVVHPMVTWSYAYQAARKGHWENFVRDRDRFKRRVKDLESILNPVLASKHRDTVYVNRFQGEGSQ